MFTEPLSALYQSEESSESVTAMRNVLKELAQNNFEAFIKMLSSLPRSLIYNENGSLSAKIFEHLKDFAYEYLDKATSESVLARYYILRTFKDIKSKPLVIDKYAKEYFEKIGHGNIIENYVEMRIAALTYLGIYRFGKSVKHESVAPFIVEHFLFCEAPLRSSNGLHFKEAIRNMRYDALGDSMLAIMVFLLEQGKLDVKNFNMLIKTFSAGEIHEAADRLKSYKAKYAKSGAKCDQLMINKILTNDEWYGVSEEQKYAMKINAGILCPVSGLLMRDPVVVTLEHSTYSSSLYKFLDAKFGVRLGSCTRDVDNLMFNKDSLSALDVSKYCKGKLSTVNIINTKEWPEVVPQIHQKIDDILSGKLVASKPKISEVKQTTASTRTSASTFTSSALALKSKKQGSPQESVKMKPAKSTIVLGRIVVRKPFAWKLNREDDYLLEPLMASFPTAPTHTPGTITSVLADEDYTPIMPSAPTHDPELDIESNGGRQKIRM